MDLMTEYLEYIKTQRKFKNNTLEAYISDVVQFKDYLRDNNIDNYSDTSQTIIITYLMSLQKSGKANSTISRNLASIRCFFQFLLSNNMIKEDPTFNLKSPKAERKIPEILTIDEVNRLLSQPVSTDFKGLRDKAMLELLYATGLRVSEIIGLNTKDIDLKLKTISMIENDNNRTLPIGSLALNALSEYIEIHKFNKGEEEPLFTNYSGNRLTRQGFWKIIKQYTKELNINKTITPHTLRHSFAVHLIENGADIKTVQKILGHSDISTTNIYSFASDHRELMEVYQKTHPRA